MTRLWRLCLPELAQSAADAFSGKGACAEPKRWSHAGTAVVYCALSAASALLEVLVQHDERRPISDHLHAFRADVPDDLRPVILDPSVLPSDWQRTPAPRALRDIGTAWIERRSSALLVVPCAIVPGELNVLVNPAHPDFARLKLSGPERFALDPRLLRGPS